MVSAFLILVAFILALLAAFQVPSPRWNLGWAAVAFYFLALLVGQIVPLVR